MGGEVEPISRLGDVHCDRLNDVQGNARESSIGVMRRLRAEEHDTCPCRGTWRGDGLALNLGNKLLEHLICTRCGYRWVADPRAVKAGFVVAG